MNLLPLLFIIIEMYYNVCGVPIYSDGAYVMKIRTRGSTDRRRTLKPYTI